MNLSPQAILDAIQQNHLLTDQQFAQVRDWVATNLLDTNAPPSADSASPTARFAQWLLDRGLLTPFQLDFIQKNNARRLRLGDYVFLDRIGVGRMAGVYKALHKGSQVVAVKVLPPSKAKDAEAFARFQREGRLASRLKHPNVVRTFDMGEADGLHYIAMEYLEGETLEDVLKRRGRLSAPETTRLLRQALEGLGHLHEQDVVHRDLKPGNLMVTSAPGNEGARKGEDILNSTVKVLDVGLGRTLFDDAPPGQVELTEAGDLLGTVTYMAPEQARDARQADVRSDLYSLGCVFYHALTGQPPFMDKNATRITIMHATQAPKPLREAVPSVPAKLAGFIEKMLAKDPAARYATPKAALAALDSDAPAAANSPAAPAAKKTRSAASITLPDPAPEEPATATTRWPLWAGLGGAAVLAVVLIVALSGNRNPEPGPQGKNPGENLPKEKATVASLTEQLKHAEAGQRVQAAKGLAEFGAAARPAYADLVELLADSESAVRAQAAETLAKLGPPTAADLPALRAALRETQPQSKIFAAEALAKLGADAKEELAYLRLLLADDNNDVRLASEQALEKLEPILVTLLIKDIKDPAPDVRRAAALALGQLKSESGKVLPNLIDALSDKNSAVRVAAADALVMLGPDAAPVLIETLKDKNFALRQTAVLTLGRMGADGSEAVPALVSLSAGEKKMAKDVQETLEKIGPYAVKGLVQAFETEASTAGQKMITDVLVKIGPEVMPALNKIAMDKKENKKIQAVAEQVAKVAPPTPKEIPLKNLKGQAGVIEANLRAWFNAADINKDNILDKEELAIAIRGAKAKPYDFAPDGKAQPQLGPKDFAKYPDFAFLSRVDRNGDGVLTRNEYGLWAQDFAEYQNQVQETQKKIADAERRLLEKKISNAMRAQTNVAIQNYWANYHQVRRQWSHMNHLEWLQRHLVVRAKG